VTLVVEAYGLVLYQSFLVPFRDVGEHLMANLQMVHLVRTLYRDSENTLLLSY
jgi:hypothetical protein